MMIFCAKENMHGLTSGLFFTEYKAGVLIWESCCCFMG